MAFLDYKNQVFKKVEKLGFFSNGLVYGFGQKIKKKFKFFFYAEETRKMCLTIFWKEKKAFLDYNNKDLKKSKN